MLLGLALLLAQPQGNVPPSTVHATRLRNMNFGFTTAIIDMKKAIGLQFLGQTIRQDENTDTPRKKNDGIPGLPHAT